MEIEKLNLNQLYEFQKQQNLDAILIPDGDFFLNEYTPAEDSVRKQLTQFKGSVGQAFTIQDKLHLIVDGRYRISAKEQFQGDQLHFVEFTPYIFPKIIELFKAANVKRLGVWFERINGVDFNVFNESFEIIDTSSLFPAAFNEQAPTKVYATNPVKMSLAEGELFVTHQVDTIARLTGLRSNYFPYMSSIPGLLFATQDQQILATSFDCQIESSSKTSSLALTQVNSLLHFPDTSSLQFKTVVYDPKVTNQSVVQALVKTFGKDRVLAKPDLNSNYMSLKEEAEIIRFKESFQLADKAIWNSLKWAKSSTDFISEVELKEKIIHEYRQVGAWSESFHPIAGFGSNSAIIHYGSPSSDKKWVEGEFLLLDSGAYFEAGVATDTTRTLYKGTPDAKAIQMYSLVLRGLIKAQMSIFPIGTLGSQVDMLAREPLLQFGKNYAHGTGHGIGVHVHEAGYLLNPLSQVPLKAGQVGSIEPGYYEEGWGGIRLENAVVVVPHPEHPNMLCFEPLTQLPFEENLIDRNLFTTKELEYLDVYQGKALCYLS